MYIYIALGAAASEPISHGFGVTICADMRCDEKKKNCSKRTVSEDNVFSHLTTPPPFHRRFIIQRRHEHTRTGKFSHEKFTGFHV